MPKHYATSELDDKAFKAQKRQRKLADRSKNDRDATELGNNKRWRTILPDESITPEQLRSIKRLSDYHEQE